MSRILNGWGSRYPDVATLITSTTMGFDDACTLLLIHESKLEQAQNQNFSSVFNANYAHIRGNAKRKGYRGRY